MEIMILPLIGIAGLYMIKKQDEKKKESFENLPNTNVPDMNYPSSKLSETTSQLSTQNKYKDSSTYTDKYFNQSMIDTSSSKKGEFMSLTGQPVDMSYFRHNNMAPFFGSKSHANNDANATESQLDHQNGSGSQYISKKEQSPMFSPPNSCQHPQKTCSLPEKTYPSKQTSRKKQYACRQSSRQGRAVSHSKNKAKKETKCLRRFTSLN